MISSSLHLFISSSLHPFISSSLHLFISSSLHLFISSSPHLSFVPKRQRKRTSESHRMKVQSGDPLATNCLILMRHLTGRVCAVIFLINSFFLCKRFRSVFFSLFFCCFFIDCKRRGRRRKPCSRCRVCCHQIPTKQCQRRRRSC